MPKTQNPFHLKDFRGIDPGVIEALAARGIKTAPQMLAAGRTRELRAALAAQTGIAPQTLLELAQLSDLARLPGVKGIRARLYYDAGITSAAKLAAWEPEALRLMVTAYVERSGFAGIPPLPKEVSSTVANAQKLEKVLEE